MSRGTIEFLIGAAMAIALYVLDKSNKSNMWVSVFLLVLMAGLIIHPALNWPWIWSGSDTAINVWRASALVCVIVLSVSLFGIWTWPDTPTNPAAKNSLPTLREASPKVVPTPSIAAPQDIVSVSPKPTQFTPPVSPSATKSVEDLADAMIDPPPPLKRTAVVTESLPTKLTFPTWAKTCRFKFFAYEHFRTDYDIEALKVQPQPFVYTEGAATMFPPIAAGYINADGILCVDATIYGGIRVHGNHYGKLPSTWDMNWNDLAVEIVNQKGVPMYSVRLVRPTMVELRGFLLLMGRRALVVPADDAEWRSRIVRLDENGNAPPGTIPDRARRIFKYPRQLHPGELEDDKELKLPW